MSNVSDAILHASETSGLPAGDSVLLMMPEDVKLSAQFPGASVWHPYADQASIWSHKGHPIIDTLDMSRAFATIVLCAPKQKDETLYLMAMGLKMLSPGGRLVAAADNLAGGKTLHKLLQTLGPHGDNLSKHKCRVVWTVPSDKLDEKAVDKAIQAGAQQAREDGFITQPGLFSWNRLDKGTNVLLHHLPFSFAGIGADFGCGGGVLGARLLQRHSDIKRLYCIDNDKRAVDCARQNLDKWAAKCDFMWADVRKLPILPPLDFVVMNPPFHQGKMESNLLGQNFIASAAAHLKPGGMLTFVANVHLPYEGLLHQTFSMQRLVSEQDGFKVIEAIR